MIAKYIQIGKTVHFRFRFTLGSTSSVATGPTITFPVTANSDYAAGGNEIGVGLASVAGADYFTYCEALTATTFRGILFGTAGTYGVTRTQFGASVPDTWASTNFFSLAGTFEAA